DEIGEAGSAGRSPGRRLDRPRDLQGVGEGRERRRCALRGLEEGWIRGWDVHGGGVGGGAAVVLLGSVDVVPAVADPAEHERGARASACGGGLGVRHPQDSCAGEGVARGVAESDLEVQVVPVRGPVPSGDAGRSGWGLRLGGDETAFHAPLTMMWYNGGTART